MSERTERWQNEGRYEASEPGRRQFRTLRERALEALEENDGEMPADALAARVLSAPPRGPWRAILDSVLADDTRIERTDRGWRLGATEKLDRSRRYVALTIGATGPNPDRHRVVRVCALGVRDGVVESRLDVILNPRRRIARYVAEATGATQVEVETSPSFAEIAEELRAMLEGNPVVIYGARWTLAMLQAESIRADVPPAVSSAFELGRLADSLGPAPEKPSLSSLARRLGISHLRPGHPPSDAAVLAHVVQRLLEATGSLNPEAQVRISHVGGEDGSVMDHTPLGRIPVRPGVYLLKDEDGEVLYVGKASSLRRRVASYRTRAPALERRLEGLAARAVRLETIETRSDLEARLLEADLIRTHRPPFNVARRVRPSALLIRCAAHDPIPRIHVTAEAVSDGAVYVGPLRSERAARGLVQLASQVYPLANERRSVDRLAQRDAVLAATRLFCGQKSDALASLRIAMRGSAEAGEPREVERVRRLVRAVMDLVLPAWPLLGTPRDADLLVIEPAAKREIRRAHRIRSGVLLASGDVNLDVDISTPDTAARVADSLKSQIRPPQHEEDVHIVTRWLGEIGDRLLVARLDGA